MIWKTKFVLCMEVLQAEHNSTTCKFDVILTPHRR